MTLVTYFMYICISSLYLCCSDSNSYWRQWILLSWYYHHSKVQLWKSRFFFLHRLFFVHPGYDTELHLVVRLQFMSCKVISLILPGLFWPRMVVPVSVSSMGQLDMFVMFRMILTYINTLALKTLILQLSMMCLWV